MIVYLPAILFGAGLILVYSQAGRARMAGTLAMVVALTWSLALLVSPGAAWWGVGPAVGSLLLPRPPARVPSTFEALTRRSVTAAVALVVALFFASRFPIGEHPLLLSALPWFLLAVGVAWFASPVDYPERLQGQVLMVAAIAAVLLSAVPGGPLTAAVAGAMALMPLAGERWRLSRVRPALSVTLLLLALASAASAIVIASAPATRVGAFDLSFSLSGVVLLAIAIVFIAGAIITPIGGEWAALLGALALSATAPSLRWAALAALIAVASGLEQTGERGAWISLGLMALTSVLQPLAAPTWSARAQALALAVGLVIVTAVARRGMLRALIFPTAVFLAVLTGSSIGPVNLPRFQWIAALGSLLLVVRALLASSPEPRPVIRDELLAGLLLLAVSARDALGLGMLAAALLVLDLAVVRVEQLGPVTSRWAADLITLARSNWPSGVTFGGATLAVAAALQAALPLGLLAALLLAALQLAPLLDRGAVKATAERPRRALAQLGPALSIVCGIAPALVFKMLRG